MADTKISDLTAVTTPATTDVYVIVQGGANFKITAAQLATLLGTDFIDTDGNAPGTAPSASGTGAVAMGSKATATQADTVSIGNSNSGSADGAKATGTSATAIGGASTGANLAGPIASGVGAFAVNYLAEASGTRGCAMPGATASGSPSFAGPTLSTGTVSGNSSVGFGERYLVNKAFTIGHGMGRFSADGDCQWNISFYKGSTANSTPVELELGDTASAYLSVASGQVYGFIANIMGKDTTSGDVAYYTRRGIIKNIGGTTSISTVQTVGTDIEDDASWDVSITADDTNDRIDLTVTGDASNTVRWNASVEYLQLS